MVPDLLGYKLDTGLQKLKELGYKEISVEVSSQPKVKDAKPSDSARIVKINELEYNKIQLIVCNL